jgi:hypothetical protein
MEIALTLAVMAALSFVVLLVSTVAEYFEESGL